MFTLSGGWGCKWLLIDMDVNYLEEANCLHYCISSWLLELNVCITNNYLVYLLRWYIGKMSASEVESVVKDVSVGDGMFVIRECITYPGDYCLHLW